MNNNSTNSPKLSKRKSYLVLNTVKPNKSSTKSKKKTATNQKYILNNLEFKKKDLIGEGTFSEVYKFRYNNKVDTKYWILSENSYISNSLNHQRKVDRTV